MDLTEQNEHMKKLITEFFDLLDYTTSTDEGKDYHPVSISCSRSSLIPKLNNVLWEMRKICEEKI